MSAQVAFIGLGNMGAPMALNLINAGMRLKVYDRVQSQVDKLASAGAEACASAVDCVKGCDFVVTMLPSGQILEDLYLDQEKMLEHIEKDALIIDCSTVSPRNSQRLAAAAIRRGLGSVDAPVSGGVAGASAGSLSFMCGGRDKDVQRAMMVLQHMGKNIFHAGDSGAGQMAKICNNMLLAIHMAGTAEALQLGVANGLDPAVLSNIMQQSSGANWSLEKYNPWPGVMEAAPASRDYQGGFMVKLMQKDLGLAQDVAQASACATPMGSTAANLFSLYRNGAADNADLDFSSIVRLYQGGDE